jgi:hypothetical protein
VFLLGAELNSELEHQTERDTTTGTAKPMGARGATVADTVADTGAAGEHATPQVAKTREPSGAAALTVVRLGSAHAGLPATLLAVGGLRSLRRGSTTAGVLMLGVGAALAWHKRTPAGTATPRSSAKA